MNYKYIIYTLQKKSERKITSIEDFQNVYKNYIQIENPDYELYTGLFNFSDDVLNHIHQNGTIKGYKGEVKEMFFVLDIDRKDLREAKQDTLKLLEFFKGYDVIPDIYFSGKKGFHLIFLPTQYGGLKVSKDNPLLMKKIAKKIMDDSGVEIDLIYQHLRIFRIEGSIHLDTNLFKIPLTSDELKTLSINQIKELATKRRFLPPSEKKISNQLKEYFSSVPSISEISFSSNSGIKPNQKLCVMQMLNKGVQSGERNESLIRIASYFIREGFNSNLINPVIHQWGVLNDLDQTEIEATIKSAQTGYSFPCTDHLLDKYCSDKCFLYERKNQIDSVDSVENNYIFSMDEAYNEYQKFVAIESFYKTGLKGLDKHLRGFVRDDIITIMGRPGTMKSSLAFRMARFNAKIGTSVVIVSIEMNIIRCLERMLQQETKTNYKEIEYKVKEGNDCYVEPMRKLKNIILAPVPFIQPTGFDELLLNIKEKIGQIPLIWVFDYLQLIGSDRRSQYEKTEFVFNEIKSFTRKHHLISIIVSQVGREAGGRGKIKPLEKGAGKGSGSIEDASDYIFGLHDDFEDNAILRCQILKNKTGGEKVDGLPFVKNYQSIDLEDISLK